ncbi:MAG TPA: glycoside hydrolase family 9 protein, partial [Cellvibrio sp.]
DGINNIVDDYTALTAATELLKTTGKEEYRKAASARANALVKRLAGDKHYRNYWRADDKNRPFFHAAEAGFPVVSLMNYYPLASKKEQKTLLAAVRKHLEFELALAAEVNNPFGLARQYVQNTKGERRSAFFYPHDTETAPWWQGENARLGSLAAAARLAAKYTDDAVFKARLEAYAWNQLNWIIGLNPFDASMLEGTGRNNVQYDFFATFQYTNAPGGIVNGITGGLDNERDIDLNRSYAETGKDIDWRWAEQWLPHTAWYIYAIALN